jgi:hypothetical protein
MAKSKQDKLIEVEKNYKQLESRAQTAFTD